MIVVVSVYCYFRLYSDHLIHDCNCWNGKLAAPELHKNAQEAQNLYFNKRKLLQIGRLSTHIYPNHTCPIGSWPFTSFQGFIPAALSLLCMNMTSCVLFFVFTLNKVWTITARMTDRTVCCSDGLLPHRWKISLKTVRCVWNLAHHNGIAWTEPQ